MEHVVAVATRPMRKNALYKVGKLRALSKSWVTANGMEQFLVLNFAEAGSCNFDCPFTQRRIPFNLNRTDRFEPQSKIWFIISQTSTDDT